MSLPKFLTENEGYGEYVRVDRISQDDGYGGMLEMWVEGAHFMATVTLDDSLQGRTALAQGVTGVYTVVVQRNVNLEPRTVFKRVSDGRYFRVTSLDKNSTPKNASIDMRTVHAQDWELTSNG